MCITTYLFFAASSILFAVAFCQYPLSTVVYTIIIINVQPFFSVGKYLFRTHCVSFYIASYLSGINFEKNIYKLANLSEWKIGTSKLEIGIHDFACVHEWFNKQKLK